MDCSSAHQWKLAYNGSVEFDADIVGPGVIASFISAALTAVITLFFAFITYSVPEELTNDVDEIVARALRAEFTFIRTVLHLPSISKTDGVEAREDRLKAFQTFMLSVSDQVLASEMAILIATFARYSDITLYSVNVVVALGCLASTVHLAMMPLLVRQMHEHHVIKASRTISMVIAAILLVVLLILQLSNTWFDGTHVYFHTYEVIRLLYSSDNATRNSHETPRHLTKATKPTTRRQRISRAIQELQEMRRYSRQSQIRDLWARHRANRVIKANLSARGQKNNAILVAETWTFYECQESFLWRILWLISGNIYGITDVFQSRSDSIGISGDRDTMGYGQIVPLVLLILPVFSAIQSIYDYRDQIKVLRQRKKGSEEDSDNSSTSASGSEALVNNNTDTNTAQESPADPLRIDTWPNPGELSRSTTTATDFQPPSVATRRNQILPSDRSSINEHIIRVHTSPTMDPPDTTDQNAQIHTDIDSSLQQWAQSDKYQEFPFARVASYMHAMLMLVFVVLLGWSMPAGPAVLTIILLGLLMIISVRRLFGVFFFLVFARRYAHDVTTQRQQSSGSAHQRPPDNSQAMMQAQGANAAAEDEE
ncbi:uncharacterized protein BDV14DRAFT_174633 [Aspergillus stella-maris]|uniref:uncharacterized protein n=1 Tax=Aspergillus stella-maris TaxID=1810926 RepID=UPI003CCE19D3